jgi:aldose 1-epimerase
VAGAPPELPSGAQHEIQHGAQRAVVVEVGGGLRAYTVGGEDRLDGYGPDEVCGGGRGQPLMPWPNRLRDGRFQFDGSEYQLGLTEPATETAIHGLVRWVNWGAVEHDDSRVTMEYVLHPQTGWPGTVELRIEYALSDDGLTVSASATNLGARACPFGAGFHPYLTLGTETIDPLSVRAPGRVYLESDERGIPVATRPVEGTPLDFRAGRELGETELDRGFADLERDSDGLARVRISTAGGERAATLWMDEAYEYLMLFTGDTLPATQRRRGLAVEPMTCPPNALQSGDGVVRLAPGDTFRGRWGIHPRG